VAGRVFGSCITFGVGQKSSAPGQMDAGKLKEILEIL
jgi:3-dehydroquinate dehydratase-1